MGEAEQFFKAVNDRKNGETSQVRVDALECLINLGLNARSSLVRRKAKEFLFENSGVMLEEADADEHEEQRHEAP